MRNAHAHIPHYCKQLREQPLEVVVILSTQVAHLSINNIPRTLLISVGGAGMTNRQQVFTASQVGSLLDEDTEFVFSGSDNDFDVEEFDPPEREQGNHQSVIISSSGKTVIAGNIACSKLWRILSHDITKAITRVISSATRETHFSWTIHSGSQ